MPVLEPESRYSKRLNQVLNYTNKNSHKNLNLDTLADMACLSKYHFARIFQDKIGESPIKFLKRTRLEKAACLLFDKQVPVSKIATNCGFSSNQSFSREFSNKFDVCPRQFRLNHLNSLEDTSGVSYLDSKFTQFQTVGIQSDLNNSAQKIQIVKKLPTKVAYVRSIGRYGGCNEIYKAMQAIKTWGQETGMWIDNTEIIGVSWDYSSMTPKTMCRYDACIPVPDDFQSKTKVSVQTIPGGLYAVVAIPYHRVKDLCLLWHWFSITLRMALKFKNYAAELYAGPWYEIYKSKLFSGRPVIEFYARLYYNRTRSESIYKS